MLACLLESPMALARRMAAIHHGGEWVRFSYTYGPVIYTDTAAINGVKLGDVF
jgi:hypothetical protein